MSLKCSTPVILQLGFSRMGTQVIDLKQIFGFARKTGVSPLSRARPQLWKEASAFPTKLSTALRSSVGTLGNHGLGAFFSGTSA
jgi:hypothetical protein